MNQIMMIVLALLVLFSSVQSAPSSGAGSSVDTDSPDNFQVPFFGMEKKWSRGVPSIRFVKRGQFIPTNFEWDK